MNLYSVTLWDSVKFEILSAQEEDLAEEALKVLRSIGKTLSCSSHNGPLENYLKPICKECYEHLEDTPTKQSSASGKILGDVSKSSPEVSSFVIKGVLPRILSLYEASDSFQRRRGLLEVLNGVLEANASTFGRWRKDGAAEATLPSVRAIPNTLDDYSNEVFDNLLSAVASSPINEVSFRAQALQGLRNISSIRGILEDGSIAAIVRSLVDIVINEASYGKDETKSLSIDLLVDIAHQKPQLVIDTAFPILVAQLPDSDAQATKPYVPVLEAIAKLSAEQQLFGSLLIRLKSRLYAALRGNASENYVVSILSALLYTFLHSDVNLSSPSRFGSLYQGVVHPFLKEIVATGGETFPQSSVTKSAAVLEMVGKICNVILKAQPFPAQTGICRNVFTIFRTSRSEDVAPFQILDSVEMLVSTQLMAALQQEATPHTDLSELLKALVEYALSEHLSPPSRNASICQIGLTVNKFIPVQQTSSIVLPFLNDPQSPLVSSSTTATKLSIRFAILKALVLRNDPKVPEIFPHFLALLKEPVFGMQAARALSSLLAPDEFLTRPNHCRILTLHKQRFFSLAVPALVDAYRTTASEAKSSTNSETAKSNYLTALSGILQHVPYNLLQPELDRLAPLLLQSLALEAADVKAAAISTLGKVVLENPGVLEQHVSSLVTRLLVVATATPAPVPATSTTTPAAGDTKMEGPTEKARAASASPPKSRAAALACLGSFVGSLKDEALIPYQRQVIRRLSTALDDERRVVRAEAVRCRASWQGLDGEGEDED